MSARKTEKSADMGSSSKRQPELVERKVFIEKAMDQNMERVKEKVEELSKGVIHPMMMVTTLKPFGDWDFYFVEGGIIRWSPNKGQEYQPVNVPEGFFTDLASIHRVFWQVLRPEGRYCISSPTCFSTTCDDSCPPSLAEQRYN